MGQLVILMKCFPRLRRLSLRFDLRYAGDNITTLLRHLSGWIGMLGTVSVLDIKLVTIRSFVLQSGLRKLWKSVQGMATLPDCLSLKVIFVFVDLQKVWAWLKRLSLDVARDFSACAFNSGWTLDIVPIRCNYESQHSLQIIIYSVSDIPPVTRVRYGGKSKLSIYWLSELTYHRFRQALELHIR